MSKPSGFSVRIFIPTGEPEGLRIVEKSNWTGQGLVFPRSLYSDVRQRTEFDRTGVYVLWGPGESGQLARVYVGEGDGVRARLNQHANSKDFWTHAAVFVSKDQNLNKAHGQYLESRLVSLALEAKRCELDNGNAPQKPTLSEADAADAEGFLNDLLLCLPVVGVSFFEKPQSADTRQPELLLKGRGIVARGFDGLEGFVVRAGSQVAKTQTASIQTALSDLRATLLKKGVIVDAGATYKLAQDYTFSSPSNASSVLLGGNSNGRTSWKDASGRTLKELQEAAAGP